MIKVLVVEDSSVIKAFLVYFLDSDPEIEVIGTANTGIEAIEAVKREKPDIITMDINMPEMNGLEATRRIMESTPVPIVIVTGSYDTTEVAITFRALEAGAVAIVRRPAGIGHPEHETTLKELVRTVKLMSEVKVVKRWPAVQRKTEARAVSPPVAEAPGYPKIRVVAMGASTGGPVALQTILSGLSGDFPVPVLMVQHIAEGFTRGFAQWLNQKTDLSVHLARDGERILPKHVYVAPDGFHMGVKRAGQIALTRDEPENNLRPSVSYLFRSVANVYGRNAAGVLLTGMGNDGALELKQLKEKGAVTIVQDKESSIVFGMPGQAIQLDAATWVLSPDGIAAKLNKLAGN